MYRFHGSKTGSGKGLVIKRFLPVSRASEPVGKQSTQFFLRNHFFLYLSVINPIGMSLFARHLPDVDIIAGLQAGGASRARFENRLYKKYLYFIREGTRKHQLAEDDCVSAYDDTILAGIDHISNGRFMGQSKLETYLYQIFTNKCVDLIRKKTTNREQVHNAISIDDTLLQLPDPARTIVQQLITQCDTEQLHHHLRAIGDKCRQMLLAWGEGYTDEEIAHQLHYNTASVAKTSRLRCLEKLREAYTSTTK